MDHIDQRTMPKAIKFLMWSLLEGRPSWRSSPSSLRNPCFSLKEANEVTIHANLQDFRSRDLGASIRTEIHSSTWWASRSITLLNWSHGLASLFPCTINEVTNSTEQSLWPSCFNSTVKSVGTGADRSIDRCQAYLEGVHE